MCESPYGEFEIVNNYPAIQMGVRIEFGAEES